MDENQESSLERLQKKLYDRQGGNFAIHRSGLSPENRDLPRDWIEGSDLPRRPAPKQSDLLYRLLVISAIVFVVTLGAAFYVFFQNTSVVSSNSIDLAIEGPTLLKAGDEADLHIAIANKNNVPLQTVDLLTEFPSGTRSADDRNQELLHSTEHIGDIASGEIVNETVKSVLFGKQNDEKDIKLTLKYRIPGTNAVMEKVTDYKLTINASPLDISVDMLPEVNSNEQTSLNIKAVSNSDTTLKNMLLEVDYPSGFQFTDANIKPTYGNNKWLLGDLEPGAPKSLTINGVLSGQDGDAKSFHVLAGVPGQDNQQKIDVTYGDVMKTVAIKKSFIGLTLDGGTLDGNGNTAIPSQTGQNFTLKWVNNLPTKVTNASISVAFSGSVLDPSSIQAAGGFYDSANNQIVWNKNTDSELGSLEPGQSGEVNFRFASLPLIVSATKSYKNPQISLHTEMDGTRVSAGFANEDIKTTLNQNVRVQSEVQLANKALYYSGPRKNSGPIPPIVNNATTYTIVWSLINSSNDVSNSIVKATLAPGVKWVGAISPSGEDLTYSAEDDTVTWDLGTLPTGAGIVSNVREATFQVSFTPSLSQYGSIPNLIGPTTFTGHDTFSGTDISVQKESLTTNLQNDPQFSPGDANVVK